MGTLNKRKGTRDGREADVAAALDELYITPPAGFVARREEMAAAAKADGRVEDARRIRAARRPTLAAWTANLLLRSQPEESRRLLELGPALREAYRTLDPTGISELSEQRRRMVSALSRQAVQLARQAGHEVSAAVQQDVEATLRAVLADPEAADQWAGGRLTGALTPPSDFPTAGGTGTAPPSGTRPKPTRPTAPPPSAGTPATDELAERRRRRQEQLDQARRDAEQAAQRLRDRHAEKAEADAAVQQASDLHDQAEQKVSAAEEQLRQARQELRRADDEQQQAEQRSRASADALARAEREAREAAQAVKRLTTRRP